MFTGIVQGIGRVRTAEDVGGLRRLSIEAADVAARLAPGDSISVDGACLTAVDFDGDAFTLEAVPATLGRTTLGALQPGDRVNLERALAAGEPLGGHIVQGHVDGVGHVVRVRRGGDSVFVDVAVPEEVFGVTVPHGSITLAGVSLTVNELPDAGVVQVSLIPYTLEHTTLGELQEGDALNVEADVIAKIVAGQTRRWLEARGASDASGAESPPWGRGR